MRDATPAMSPRSGRFGPVARTGLLALVMALAACKGGKPDPGKDGADAADKGPEAVPVEVATAARRSIAASYMGTAPLEARAESQVVAKTSGLALRVFVDVGIAVDPEGQLGEIVGADRKSVEQLGKRVDLDDVVGNLAHHVDLESVLAALQAVGRHGRDDGDNACPDR